MVDANVGGCGEDLGTWEGAVIPSEHWHFHRRILERYGFVLPPGSFSTMFRRLRAEPGKAALRLRRNLLTGREVWGVYVPDGGTGQLCYVVWLPRKQAVITALPPSAKLYAEFRRARGERKEQRQRRRLPVLRPVPGLPALVRRVLAAFGPRSAGFSGPERAEGAGRGAAPGSAGRRPFLGVEIILEREKDDPRPVPAGSRAERAREVIFHLRAILFRRAT